MGKTSVALKIVHDARIIKKFGKYRLWVACEQATSVPLLIELLAKVLKLPTSASGDRFSDVIAFLESLDVLVIFLFDNFETPWDIEGQRSDFGDVLARLASIPNVSIILTMRGNQCPYEESIDWSLPRLPFLTQLDLVAAEEAFLRISPNSSGDAELHTLLRELDCVPLAITLMAKLASGGESVHELLLQWKTERTRLLGQAGGDRRTSIEVSIKLSMDSQAVKANKDAITLIGIFAMLPGGAAVSRLPDMCPSIPNWNAALRVLLGAALVYHNPDRSLIQVLSPIRSYVLLHHPLEELPLGELQASYYRLAGKGASQPGDPDFLTNAKELGMEETNMEAILLDALQRHEKDKSSIISASLDYSNHLFWTQPRSNIMTVTTEVARTHHDPALADCLNTLGLILQYQTHYDAAKAAMEEAQAEYVSRGNRSGAANCLKSIGQILQMQTQYEAAEAALKEARAEYISLENRLGAANCLNTLGEILQLQSQYDAAEAMLKEARAEYISLGDRLGSANCLNALGEILQGQSQYDAAEVMLKEARAEYVSLGNRLGATNCLKSLGQILQMQAQYDAAESTLKEARAEYISFGDRLGAADCLKSLGGVLLAQTQYHAAHAALMEAKAEFVSLRNRLGVANCLYILGRESRIQGRFADALSQLEEARELYCAIGQVKWAEICSEQSSLASTMDSSA
ncbi:hypothetical protein FRC02_000401 [Tulasnella sp. 418]|nr:hypothetical protein FRC02_000401 [Tulasnella sp. 418]